MLLGLLLYGLVGAFMFLAFLSDEKDLLPTKGSWVVVGLHLASLLLIALVFLVVWPLGAAALGLETWAKRIEDRSSD